MTMRVAVTPTVATAVSPTAFTTIGTISMTATLRFAAAIAPFIVARRRLLAFAGAAHFLVAIRHGRFARKFHAALLVDAQALHPDFIAHFYDVFGLLDAEVRQFADVNKAVLAGQEFDERAEILN